MSDVFVSARAAPAAVIAALLTLAPLALLAQTNTTDTQSEQAPTAGAGAAQSGAQAQGAETGSDAAGTGTGGTGQGAEDPVLAIVNGKELRRSDVVASAAEMPEQFRSQIDQLMPALVDRLVDMTLISEVGQRQNLKSDPEVQALVQRFTEDAIRQVTVQRFLKDKLNEDLVKARYDKMVAEIPPVTEVRARHILVDSKEKAAEIIAQLQSDPAKFAELAKTQSKDPSAAANEGDLGYFTEDQMVPEFAQAAFALEPNKISAEPVQTQFGWHVIQVLDKRQRPAPTMDELRPQIEAELQQELVATWLKELRTAANVQRFNPDGTPMQDLPPEQEGVLSPAEQAPAAVQTAPAAGDGQSE